jgi:prepilin-type N-terminal cleavage/methylation domain-containing protein
LKKTGYTLIEILVVLVIIATLVALAWPNYMAIKEKTLNSEAKASLSLIRAAEKIYRMEQGYYYPYLTSTSTVSDINSYLKISLPEASIKWSVSLNSPSASTGTGTATRTGTGADGRAWQIDFTNDADPTCSGGTSCPP